MNKKAVINFAKGVKQALKKHSPELLTGIGIVGMIAAAVTAVRATPKALQLIDEKEIKDGKRLGAKEVVKATWKCYVPATVTGTLSVACLIGASAVNSKRNAALAAACTLSEAALRDYKEQAMKVVGPKKEQAIRDAVAKEELERNPLGSKEVLMTHGGDVLCHDPISGRYFKSDINTLKSAANALSRRMMIETTVTLNELYDEIGLPHNDMGECLGWELKRSSDCVEFDFSTQLAENGEPCLVAGYVNPPTYIL